MYHISQAPGCLQNRIKSQSAAGGLRLETDQLAISMTSANPGSPKIELPWGYEIQYESSTMRSHRGKIDVSRELAASTARVSGLTQRDFAKLYMNISKANMTRAWKVECVYQSILWDEMFDRAVTSLECTPLGNIRCL